jgi:hypothetical protein
MCLLRRDGKRDVVMMVGMVFLILANVAQLVFRHAPAVNEDLTDLIRGLLFGLAIGTLLVAIWRNSHRAV